MCEGGEEWGTEGSQRSMGEGGISNLHSDYSTVQHQTNYNKHKLQKMVRRLPEYILNDFSHIGSRHSLSKPAALHQLSGYCPHLTEMEGDNSEGEGVCVCADLYVKI